MQPLRRLMPRGWPIRRGCSTRSWRTSVAPRGHRQLGLRFRGVFARPDAPPRGQPPRQGDPDDQADNRADCGGQQRFGLDRLIGHCGLVLQSRWRTRPAMSAETSSILFAVASICRFLACSSASRAGLSPVLRCSLICSSSLARRACASSSAAIVRVCGRLSLLAEDLSVRQVNGVSELCGTAGSCVAGTNGNEVAIGGGLDRSRFSSSLRVSRFPVRAMTRSDTIGDSMNWAWLITVRSGSPAVLGSHKNAHNALIRVGWVAENRAPPNIPSNTRPPTSHL